MPEKLNFNVGIPNSGIDAYGRKRQPYAKPLRLYDVVESIRSNPRLEGWLKEELIKKVSNYPAGALKHFLSTIDSYVEILRKEKIENERKRNED